MLFPEQGSFFLCFCQLMLAMLRNKVFWLSTAATGVSFFLGSVGTQASWGSAHCVCLAILTPGQKESSSGTPCSGGGLDQVWPGHTVSLIVVCVMSAHIHSRSLDPADSVCSGVTFPRKRKQGTPVIRYNSFFH
jgi:hypothetical protein